MKHMMRIAAMGIASMMALSSAAAVPVYIDGELDEGLCAHVRNNAIVLDATQGLYLIIR